MSTDVRLVKEHRLRFGSDLKMAVQAVREGWRPEPDWTPPKSPIDHLRADLAAQTALLREAMEVLKPFGVYWPQVLLTVGDFYRAHDLLAKIKEAL